MKTLEFKRKIAETVFLLVNPGACKMLDVEEGDRINLIRDENNYLQVYKIGGWDEEKGFTLRMGPKDSPGLNIFSDSIAEFGKLGEVFKIEDNPEYNTDIEKLIFDLTKIEEPVEIKSRKLIDIANSNKQSIEKAVEKYENGTQNLEEYKKQINKLK